MVACSCTSGPAKNTSMSRVSSTVPCSSAAFVIRCGCCDVWTGASPRGPSGWRPKPQSNRPAIRSIKIPADPALATPSFPAEKGSPNSPASDLASLNLFETRSFQIALITRSCAFSAPSSKIVIREAVSS